MSKFEELINKYCPDGTEYVELGTICDIKGRIGFRGYTRNDIVSEGDGAISLSPTNIVDGSITYDKCTYISWEKYEESPEIMIANNDIIFTKTASVGKVAIIRNLPQKATINPQLVVLKNIKCNPSFLYYALSNNTFQSQVKKITGLGTIPTISQNKFAQLTIPLPSLPVQEEIVRILDKFTELQAELQTELQAEFEARRKQYEYYRDGLLTFGNDSPEGGLCRRFLAKHFPGFDPDTVEYVRLGDVLDYEQPGKYIVRNTDYNDSYTTPVLTAGQSFILGYTDEEFGIYEASPEKPIIIFDDFTTSSHWVDFAFKVKSSAMKMLTPHDVTKANFRYLYYIIKSIKYDIDAQTHARQWIGKYSNISIPLPPIEVQEKIVSILDRFESLANSITEGLPAEIEARRKQYEYYRDRLLTFKKKEEHK